jgi:fructan beta-fructosidase
MSKTKRPVLHFTPPQGWLNDPNGLFHLNGAYHLFYQYHPHSLKWGPMHWGHATSRDLVHWTHQPVALDPDEQGMIFSGSAAVDLENASGFGDAGQTPVLLLFTHHGEQEQQGIAWSVDGIHFTKHIGNPVIPNPGITDFRDPKLFRNPVKGGWSCVVASGDHVRFYHSTNFVDWTETGRFGQAGNPCPGIWECPDLFPLTAPDGSVAWVLLGSMILSGEVNSHRTQYLTGTFDGDTFLPAEPSAPVRWLDAGFDHYAGVTFDNHPDRILMAWASAWPYAGDVPASSWRGMMTLARRLRLHATDAGLRLASEPVLPAHPDPGTLDTSRLTDGAALPAGAIHLQADCTGPFTLTMENSLGDRLVFGLSGTDWFADRSGAGDSSFSEAFRQPCFSQATAPRAMPLPGRLDVVLDGTLLELFADNGVFSCTMAVFPHAPYDRLRIEGMVVCHGMSLQACHPPA